jgi:hypothetical protein
VSVAADHVLGTDSCQRAGARRLAPRQRSQTRLLLYPALALLCSAALAADRVDSSGPGYAPAPAGCRQVSGGRLQGLQSPVIWHARMECGGSTMIWFQTLVGKQGANPVWRVDDLLIVPQLEDRQTLSLFAPMDVECRHHSAQPSLVIAAGEWSPRAGQGARQSAKRAWRVDPVSKKVEELPARDVTCVLR